MIEAAVATAVFGTRATLARTAAFSGVGLHTGAPVQVELKPSPAGAGIVFVRSDLAGAIRIPARADLVVETGLGTVLAPPAGIAAGVRTIEHLMCALALAGVDDVVAEVSGPEVPILDGSAREFLRAIEEAGIVDGPMGRLALTPNGRIALEDGPRVIEWSPGEGRQLEVSIDFEERAIGRQSAVLDLDGSPCEIRNEGGRAARDRVASARTFCRRSEIVGLRAAGLALGGSLDNAIVVDGDAILNPGGLRDPEEFALHKALDLIGDLALCGAPLLGRIVARRPGHDLNVAFARKITELAAKAGFDPPDARL